MNNLRQRNISRNSAVCNIGECQECQRADSLPLCKRPPHDGTLLRGRRTSIGCVISKPVGQGHLVPFGPT